MIYVFSFLFAAAIVAADQILKAFISGTLALGQIQPLLPGLVHLTYVQNDGMSFSLLSGARWFFVVMTILIFALAIFAIAKRWVTGPFGLLSLAAVLGGAVGNLIDRIRFGYVVDMIELEFMHFAVFNLADIFVVCGGIAFCIWGVFFWKDPNEGKPPVPPKETP